MEGRRRHVSRLRYRRSYKYIMNVLEKGIKILRGGIALSGAAARLLIGAGAAAVVFMGLIKKKKK